jgi:predicted enzyme related to lactoylglutathione lyase
MNSTFTKFWTNMMVGNIHEATDFYQPAMLIKFSDALRRGRT